ncbi:MAG: hypothetical protein QOD63_1135 [Actinomycetota bacterium]|nr:hypothetical protein [Actinomycetota bacterium]
MDLGAGYREWAPPSGLGGAVACVWARVAANAPEPTSTLVLPDACSDLIWSAGRGVHVAGPDTAPWLSQLDPGGVLVGVRFAPGAGGPALRMPLDDLRDQRVPLDDVVPQLGTALPGDLPPAAALDRLLEIAAAMVSAGPPDLTVQAATRLLADPHTSVADACERVGLSERQLRRRCRQAVGYGPKTLQRILRFRRFVAWTDTGPASDLAGIAATAGYADQAHLTRECRDLAGMTPAALVARSRSGQGRSHAMSPL